MARRRPPSSRHLAVDDASSHIERVAYGLVETGWGLVDDGRISVLVASSAPTGVARAALGASALVAVKRDWLSANHFEVLGLGRDTDAAAIKAEGSRSSCAASCASTWWRPTRRSPC